MTQNNLLCLHSGTAYGPDYVLNLWQGARRNSKRGFDFWVFTDNIQQHPQDYGWKFVQLPQWKAPNFHPWWYKMWLFSNQHQLEGNNLYFDLDVVVVGDIDCFWEYYPDEFRICQDFNRAFSRQISFANSSVMAWRSNSMTWLYQRFAESQTQIIQRYRGDQDYIHAETKAQQRWWPTEWAMSWKWEIKRGGQSKPHGPYRSVEPYVLPTDTKLIVCHGNPNPHEIPEIAPLWSQY